MSRIESINQARENATNEQLFPFIENKDPEIGSLYSQQYIDKIKRGKKLPEKYKTKLKNKLWEKLCWDELKKLEQEYNKICGKDENTALPQRGYFGNNLKAGPESVQDCFETIEELIKSEKWKNSCREKFEKLEKEYNKLCGIDENTRLPQRKDFEGYLKAGSTAVQDCFAEINDLINAEKSRIAEDEKRRIRLQKEAEEKRQSATPKINEPVVLASSEPSGIKESKTIVTTISINNKKEENVIPADQSRRAKKLNTPKELSKEDEKKIENNLKKVNASSSEKSTEPNNDQVLSRGEKLADFWSKTDAERDKEVKEELKKVPGLIKQSQEKIEPIKTQCQGFIDNYIIPLHNSTQERIKKYKTGYTEKSQKKFNEAVKFNDKLYIIGLSIAGLKGKDESALPLAIQVLKQSVANIQQNEFKEYKKIASQGLFRCCSRTKHDKDYFREVERQLQEFDLNLDRIARTGFSE